MGGGSLPKAPVCNKVEQPGIQVLQSEEPKSRGSGRFIGVSGAIPWYTAPVPL